MEVVLSLSKESKDQFSVPSSRTSKQTCFFTKLRTTERFCDNQPYRVLAVLFPLQTALDASGGHP